MTSIECSAQAKLGSNRFHHDPWKSFYREHVVEIENPTPWGWADHSIEKLAHPVSQMLLGWHMFTMSYSTKPSPL